MAFLVAALTGCSGGSGSGGGPTAASGGSGSSPGIGATSGPAAGGGGPGGTGSDSATSSGGATRTPAPLPTEPDGCVQIGTANVVDAGTSDHPLPVVLLGGGLRAVIMVNAHGENLCRWLPLARSLVLTGLRVVLYDPRAGTAAELAQVAGWLRDRGNAEVAYLGAGSGAAVALTAAKTTSPPPYAVVALTPTTVPGRPAPIRLLVVAASGDRAGAETARQLVVVGRGTLRLVPGSGRGAALVTGPAAAPLVAELAGYLHR